MPPAPRTMREAMVDGTIPLTLWGLKKKLRKNNIKGMKESSRTCPIAIYLSQQFGEPVLVSYTEIIVGDIGAKPLMVDWVDTPRAVRAFVRKFDNGELSEFEQESS